MQWALHYWYSEYMIHKTVSWNTFPYRVQESAKLFKAYYKQSNFSLYDYNKSWPLWEKEHLINIMRKLVCSGGFLVYSDLCEEFGGAVIDSFIEHNILHLCPTRQCSFDLPASFYNMPLDVPIVTTELACGLYAMRLMFEQLKISL